MCQDSKSFTTVHQLEDPIDVVLGDGRALLAVGRGEVVLDMVLLNCESKSCMLHDVLYVPTLSYNLLSVAKASQKGKIVKFTKSACYNLDKRHNMVAKATEIGSGINSTTSPTTTPTTTPTMNKLALLRKWTQKRIFGTSALGIWE